MDTDDSVSGPFQYIYWQLEICELITELTGCISEPKTTKLPLLFAEIMK